MQFTLNIIIKKFETSKDTTFIIDQLGKIKVIEFKMAQKLKISKLPLENLKTSKFKKTKLKIHEFIAIC